MIVLLIDSKVVDFIQILIVDVFGKGVEVVIGNKCEGNFIYFMFLDDVNDIMCVVWEELFGFVLLIICVFFD